jgi:hypothetical protein
MTKKPKLKNKLHRLFDTIIKEVPIPDEVKSGFTSALKDSKKYEAVYPVIQQNVLNILNNKNISPEQKIIHTADYIGDKIREVDPSVSMFTIGFLKGSISNQIKHPIYQARLPVLIEKCKKILKE